MPHRRGLSYTEEALAGVTELCTAGRSPPNVTLLSDFCLSAPSSL